MLSRFSCSRTSLAPCRTVHIQTLKSTRAHSTSLPTPNDKILAALQKWQVELKDSNPSPAQLRSLNMAVKRFQDHSEPVTTGAQVAELLRNTGRGVVGRVVTYVESLKTNISEKELNERLRQSDRVIEAAEELRTVTGIGPKLAMKLASSGCLSVQQLSEPRFHDLLPSKSRTELEWSSDITPQVTLEQAQTIAEFIRANLSSQHDIVLVGSHRRSITSRTINIVLSHPSYVHIPTPSDNVYATFYHSDGRASVIKEVLQTLRSRGLVVGEMSDGVRVWKGIMRVPARDERGVWESRWSRLDGIQARDGVFVMVEIVLTPVKSKGAALLANTGDRKFHTDMMLSAKKLGMHLDDFGLWRWQDANPASTSTPGIPEVEPESNPWNKPIPMRPDGHWVLVAGETEESIFTELNRPYVDPERRNFGFLKDSGKKPRLRDLPNTRKGRPKVVEDEQPKRLRGRPRKQQSPSSESTHKVL